MKLFTLSCIAAALAMNVGSSSAASLADSVADFSLTQGSNNWYYGYYPADNLTASGFTLLDSTAGDFWHHSATWWPSWTSIFADVVHPNGVNSPDELEWVVRRWVSPGDFNISISGLLAKFDTGGNGVVGSILVDGHYVFSRCLGPSDLVGDNYFVSTSVAAGSTVDFVVRPQTTDYYDSTLFTALISTSEIPVPEPSAIAIAGLGLLAVCYRRKP